MNKNLLIEALEVAVNSYEFDGEKEKAAAIKGQLDFIEKIKAEYEKSYWLYERLERDTFDPSNTESYENTVERLYRQGHSDALAGVIRLLENGE
jgi:hypothetical protein